MADISFQSDVLAERLKTARVAAGLSTRDVAKLLADDHPVSHVTIGKYERAKSVPTLDVVMALANAYKRSLAWFLENGPKLTGVRYRNLKSKVRQGDRNWFEANAQRWLEAYVRLERKLGQELKPSAKLPVVSPYDEPATVARNVRKALGIRDNAPVPSVVEAIERCGVRVIELPTALRIDGIAGRFGDDLAIVLNPTTRNDRCRMNATHEWGHGLFGHCSEASEVASKEQEDLAYEFASNFILPDSQLRAAFHGKSMVRLVKFKETFGISLAAMIHRAERANILNAGTARHLWIEFAKRGWRMNEPGRVRADRATRFEQLLEGAITSGHLSWRDAEIVTGVPAEDLRERVRVAMGLEATTDHREEGENEEIENDVLKFETPEDDDR